MKNRIKFIAVLLICLLAQIVICFAQTNDELIVRAKASIQKGEFDAAVSDSSAVIKTQPNNGEALTQRARAYFLLKNYDFAAADAEKALTIDAKNVEAINICGLVKLNRQQTDAALADFTTAIAVNPNFIKPYLNRGGILRGKKEFDKATADFTKAIAIDPQNTVAYQNRGLIYLEDKKDFTKAVADFTELIKINPKSAAAYIYRGESYLKQKDYDRAIADENAALALDPKNIYALEFRADSYFYKTEYAAAFADYTRILELDPKNYSANFNRGLIYKLQKNYDAANTEFGKIPAGEPYYDSAREQTNEIKQTVAEAQTKAQNGTVKTGDAQLTLDGKTAAEKAKRLEDELPVAFTDHKIFIFTFMHTRDGFELVTDNNGYKKYAWKAPDWSPTEYDPTDEKRIINVRNDVWTVDVAPPDETAWSWNYGGKISFTPIVYETHVKRLYYFSAKYESGVLDKKVKIYSISRDDKKPKFEGEIQWDKNVTFVINSEGKVFKITFGTEFRVEDLKGNKIYSAERFVQGGYYSPNVSVSTDGTRLIVTNYFVESLVIRLEDGAELIYLLEKDARQGAIDKTGRYIATAFDASLTAEDRLKAYRVKITIVPDEPHTNPKSVWLSTPGARESAIADIKIRDAREAENKRVEAARLAEMRRIEAEEARRKQTAAQANSTSNAQMTVEERNRIVDEANGLIEESKVRIKDAVRQKGLGYAANAYCTPIYSAKDFLQKALRNIDRILAVYPKDADTLAARDDVSLAIKTMDDFHPCY